MLTLTISTLQYFQLTVFKILILYWIIIVLLVIIYFFKTYTYSGYEVQLRNTLSKLKSMWDEKPSYFLLQIRIVIFEEVLFRLVPVFVLDYFSIHSLGRLIVFVSVTLLFSFLHVRKTFHLYSFIEFSIFFFLLVLYLNSVGDFFIPFICHLVRNVFVTLERENVFKRRIN